MSTKQPFVLFYPKEILRIFTAGKILAPDHRVWSLAFCPGITGSYYTAVKFTQFAREGIVIGYNPYTHLAIIKWVINFDSCIYNYSWNTLKSIIPGINNESRNIVNLWKDKPFGWIPRILKGVIYDCLTIPILKVITGGTGVVIITPLTFMGLTIPTNIFVLMGCTAMSFVSLCLSPISLIGGSIYSAIIATSAVTCRFPNPSDNKKYGMRIEGYY